MAESHLTDQQKTAVAIIRESANAVVSDACGTDVSDSDVDWEATTFSRHKLPDFNRLEGRQCAVSMAGCIAERLYLGQPWREDEATLRGLLPDLASLGEDAESDPGHAAARPLLIIRSYHPDLSDDQLIATYRQHEQDTHDWLQQIEVWTAVLEKARGLGLHEAGGND